MRRCGLSNIARLSLIFVCFIAHANTANAGANSASAAFKLTLARFEDAARTYRAVYNLPPLPEFREIARNPRTYIDGCLALLSEDDIPRRRREVAILMMVQLELDDRLAFLNGMLSLFDAGKIRDYELGEALFPPARLSGGLVLDSGDRHVVDLLQRVQKDDRLAPDIRATAGRLLSGDAMAELLVADLTLLKHGHLPPSLIDFGEVIVMTIGTAIVAHPFSVSGAIAALIAGLAVWGRKRQGRRHT